MAADTIHMLREKLEAAFVKEPETDCWRRTVRLTSMVNVPGQGAHTVRRVLYAAYVGPVPAGMEVVGCERSLLCVSPHHAKLRPGGGNVRALDLGLEPPPALEKQTQAVERPAPPPPGEAHDFVKRHGASIPLAQLKQMTGLSASVIMKIRAGVL